MLNQIAIIYCRWFEGIEECPESNLSKIAALISSHSNETMTYQINQQETKMSRSAQVIKKFAHLLLYSTAGPFDPFNRPRNRILE